MLTAIHSGAANAGRQRNATRIVRNIVISIRLIQSLNTRPLVDFTHDAADGDAIVRIVLHDRDVRFLQRGEKPIGVFHAPLGWSCGTTRLVCWHGNAVPALAVECSGTTGGENVIIDYLLLSNCFFHVGSNNSVSCDVPTVPTRRLPSK